MGGTGPLWFSSVRILDMNTGPLSSPLARSLALLTHSLAPPCSLRLRAPLRSLVCSLAHFAHSLARGKVYDLMSQFHLVLTHSAMAEVDGWLMNSSMKSDFHSAVWHKCLSFIFLRFLNWTFYNIPTNLFFIQSFRHLMKINWIILDRFFDSETKSIF